MALHSREEVDLKLISLCPGNSSVSNSLRNTLSLFHVLELERKFRTENFTDSNSKQVASKRPIISVGMRTSLEGVPLDATDFHGLDGLGNVHEIAPEYSAKEEWINLFEENEENSDGNETEDAKFPFVVSKRPSYLEILDILREEEPNTVTICAIGPLMNLAKAAEIDLEIFTRVKEVIIMGGALSHVGNATPTAEFNVFADPKASAIIYGLTGPNPRHILGDIPLSIPPQMKSPLHATIFPLDITSEHVLYESDYRNKIEPLLQSGSPLAKWIHVWMDSTFKTSRIIHGFDDSSSRIHMHDPLAVWYAQAGEKERIGWNINRGRDVRVETEGLWTIGHTVVDSRGRTKRGDEVANDHGYWLNERYGNRVDVAVSSPFGEGGNFGRNLLDFLF